MARVVHRSRLRLPREVPARLRFQKTVCERQESRRGRLSWSCTVMGHRGARGYEQRAQGHGRTHSAALKQAMRSLYRMQRNRGGI